MVPPRPIPVHQNQAPHGLSPSPTGAVVFDSRAEDRTVALKLRAVVQIVHEQQAAGLCLARAASGAVFAPPAIAPGIRCSEF